MLNIFLDSLVITIVAVGLQPPPGERPDDPLPPSPLSASTVALPEDQIQRIVDAAIARVLDKISPADGSAPYRPTPPPSPSPGVYPAPQGVYAAPQGQPTTYAASAPARVRVMLPRGPVQLGFDSFGNMLKRISQPRIREYALAPVSTVEFPPLPPVWASPQR